MSIWIYEDTALSLTEQDVTGDRCMFCHSSMESLSIESGGFLEGEIGICLCCGWWCRNERYHRRIRDEDYIMPRYTFSMEGACAQLKNLDVSDGEIPLNDLQNYLTAKYDERFNVNPRILENLVASIYKEHGYSSYVTAYQNDGGIDVILSKGTENIGVQVKRYRNKIEAEQIRSLAGALMLGDHTSGMFVTTSKFRSGAKKAAKGFSNRGLPIELIDAERFYDALKISKKIIHNKDDIEELYYKILSIGSSQVIYEDEEGLY